MNELKKKKEITIMRIAISSTGRELDSNLDPRFGRAEYFIIVDPETMAFEVVENSQNFNLPQGAGIQAGKTIADNKVDTLITGHCGPKAFKVLQSAGVKIMTGASGKIADVIAQFKSGELETATEADVDGHWV
jgi:predicted Fe-Mo cluster-binding NifX family protein